MQKHGKAEKINNSPCVSAAKIWSRSTWLSEKHISKHIQSIARAIVWELPLQRWLFLSVVNFEQSPSSWGRKKGGKCRRKVLRVELQRGRRTFLSVSPTRRQTDGYSQVVSNLSACAGLHRARLPHPFRELRGGYLGCWWRQLPGKKPGRFEGGCPIFFFFLLLLRRPFLPLLTF